MDLDTPAEMDYFDDGFRAGLENEARIEFKVESLIVYQGALQVLENMVIINFNFFDITSRRIT